MNYLFWILVVAFIVLAVWFAYEIVFGKDEMPDPIPYLDVPEDTGVRVPQKSANPKKIEAVMVCVNYGDFLAWTLPMNKIHFNRLVVVTDSKDTYTQEICSYYHVECVVTDSFYVGGGFNKANGINFGLGKLDKDGWVVHLDADIALPPRTGQILRQLPLDENSIYGIDRSSVFGLDNWIRFLQNPVNQHSSTGFLYSGYVHGARLLNLDRDGWIPIGYFQMWCPSASRVVKYPNFHQGADRTDALFPYNWERKNRHLIPELICYHLESEESELGINWRGRKTRRFEL